MTIFSNIKAGLKYSKSLKLEDIGIAGCWVSETENPRVGGSIPPLGTIYSLLIQRLTINRNPSFFIGCVKIVPSSLEAADLR